MSEFNVTKRLLGKEDISFDTDGTGAKTTHLDSAGTSFDVNKLNAGHIPITAAAREKITGVTDIDSALGKLADDMGALNASSLMAADTTVTFLAEDSVSGIQTKINLPKKNLGGHTLTFVFPEGLTYSLSQKLSFSGFYNGLLVLDGASCVFSDSVDLGGLFEFTKCTCAIEMSDFEITHTLSDYGVLAGTSCIVMTSCVFTGDNSAGSYAVYVNLGGVRFVTCTFTTDKKVLYTGNVRDEFDILEATVSDIQTDLTTAEGDIAALEADNPGKDFSKAAATLDFITDFWTATDGLTWYKKYRSGFVEQGGYVVAPTSGSLSSIVTYPVPFVTMPASLLAQELGTNTDALYDLSRISNVTDDAFIYAHHAAAGNPDMGFFWYASGKAATT